MTHHFSLSSSPISWPATEYPKYVSLSPYLTIGKRFSKLNAAMLVIQQLNIYRMNAMYIIIAESVRCWCSENT